MRPSTHALIATVLLFVGATVSLYLCVLAALEGQRAAILPWAIIALENAVGVGRNLAKSSQDAEADAAP